MNIDVFTFDDFISAIQNAEVGDEINFFIQNDIVFEGSVGITKSLTINLINDGVGNVTLRILEGGTYRHFTTGAVPIADVSVTVGAGITLDGSGTGGGIFVRGSNGSVTLDGCTFRDCRSATNGGGVLVQGSTNRSVLIINDGTVITDCRAVFGGGAAALASDVILNGGTIIYNTASNSGGGISLGESGGLGSDITINGGIITSNTATANDGGGIYAQNTIVTIMGGEISNNTADGRGGGISIFSSVIEQTALRIHGGIIIGNRIRNFGGGIGVQNRLSELIMTGGVITRNSADIPSGSNQGGGIYYEDGSIFEMRGGRISDNTAGSGGGIFLNNSTLNMNGTAEVIENESFSSAGGIYGFQGCTITISEEARVTNNKALCNDDPERQDRGGGGIAILSFGRTSTVTIRDNAVISDNSSVSYGGGIWTYPNFGPATFVNIEGGIIENNSANFGGGISMGEIPGELPELIITGGVITHNTAITDGGGIIARASIVSVADSEITNNTAGRNGGGIGIFYEDLPNLTVSSDVLFSENRADIAYNRNPIDDELYFSHIFATNWTIPFPQGYNNFDIEYTNGEPFEPPEPPEHATVVIRATKRLCGACLCGNDFAFGIFDEGGNLVSEARNNSCGNINFPALEFNHSGVFEYTVRELSTSCRCFKTDKRIYTIIITVTENDNGQLSATICYPNGRPCFINHFCPPCPPCNRCS